MDCVKRNEMRQLIRDVLHEVGHKTEKVAVEIYGKLDYLTEREVRALQVIALRKAKESEEAYKEFCDNIVIYKGRYKGHKRDKSHRITSINRDGKFNAEFDKGFYNVNDDLAMILFDESPILRSKFE